jgi:hypothetical protein
MLYGLTRYNGAYNHAMFMHCIVQAKHLHHGKSQQDKSDFANMLQMGGEL